MVFGKALGVLRVMEAITMHSARRFVQVVLVRVFLQIVQMLQLYVVSHPVRLVSKRTNLRMSQANQHTCPLVQDASEK